jgi:serine/threonine-protein kinase
MRYTSPVPLTTSSRLHPNVSVASLAVLPFVHLGASADEEYFSEGIADLLSSALAKIRGLRVSARSSSFHFSGRDTDLAEVARELGVATVLEGTVRKDGRRMLVSVQLVDVTDGRHLWRASYDRPLDDIFAVEDDIAQSVVSALRVAPLDEGEGAEAGASVRAEVANAFRGRGTNVEAHLLFLQARQLFERYNRDDSARAIECLEKAVAMEPDYALAWALMGDAHYRRAGYGWGPLADSRRRAREARERALAIEPLLEAHLSMAAARHYDDRDHEGARGMLREVLEQAPGNASALRLSGIIAMHAGRLEEAIGHYHRALEPDPLSARTHHSLAWCLHSIGRHVEAVAAYRKALELVPHMVGTRALLAFVLVDLGRGEEGLAEAAIEPNEAMRLYALACLQWTLGRRDEADAALDQLIQRLGDEAPSQIAGVYATRGDLDQAFEWLDRAHRIQDPGLLELRNFPNFRPVRSDPRWGAFLRRAGL